MVCINTNPRILKKSSPELEIKHFVEMPDGLIATARHTDSNRIKVYWVNNERIYERQGLKGSWEELESESRRDLARVIRQAIDNKLVPYYTTQFSLQLN